MNLFQFFTGGNIFITLGIFLLLFFVFREIFTWYWKVNKMVSLLEQIEENTRKEGVVQLTDEEIRAPGPIVSENNKSWFTRPITTPKQAGD